MLKCTFCFPNSVSDAAIGMVLSAAISLIVLVFVISGLALLVYKLKKNG